MAKFLNRFETSDALKDIILDAHHQLILISPYIKLNPEIKDALSTHLRKPELQITIVYGKNEEDKTKSLSDEDYNFFMRFANISIRYHKRLHAKMYANDYKCLCTSLNLHHYSLRENIEFGILTESKLLDLATHLINFVVPKTLSDPLDSQAMEFVDYIVLKSTIEFEKTAKKTTSAFGLLTTYASSKITTEKHRSGYCIRTREPIPFNILRPYSPGAYNSWSKYNNPNYIEKFCHRCGNENRSTMAKPVCYDCFKSQ